MFFLKDLPTQQMLQAYQRRFPTMDMRATDGALHLLRRASLLMRELEAYFTLHALSQTRFLILIVIDREPDVNSLSPSQIADKLDVSRPVVTDTIAAMERADLLQSVKSADDGRSKHIFLTPHGAATLAALLPGYFALIDQFMSKPSSDDCSKEDCLQPT